MYCCGTVFHPPMGSNKKLLPKKRRGWEATELYQEGKGIRGRAVQSYMRERSIPSWQLRVAATTLGLEGDQQHSLYELRPKDAYIYSELYLA